MPIYGLMVTLNKQIQEIKDLMRGLGYFDGFVESRYEPRAGKFWDLEAYKNESMAQQARVHSGFSHLKR